MPAKAGPAWLVALVLAIGSLVAVGGPANAAPDPESQALARLDQDADRPLTVREAPDGTAEFVGVPARGEVDHPGVDPSMGAGAAADAAVRRYGAAVGTAQPGTTVERTSVQSTLAGEVARYQQQVDGVPVIGGQVVVGLRTDNSLSSLQSTTTTQTEVDDAEVTEQAAVDAAVQVVRRDTGATGLRATSRGRWLFDPAALGQPDYRPAGGVWRIEVSDRGAVRHLVLVDDQDGTIALDIDENQQIDRVVCNNNNVRRSTDVACTSGFARTETSGTSAVADVNSAFDLSGIVSGFYSQVGGIDMTDLLGIDVGGIPRLASTVRWCYTGTANPCPYPNAFWNGSQMYYGAGYAGADDVVGHEMTHGVIDQFSELFYWGQSGAINESIADIMGEIVDQRSDTPGEPPDVWDLGEEIPGGAIRNLADPPDFDQPDRMTSELYSVDGVLDNGGVHINSGVGNHTAYLISQGGTFNGVTVDGIDGADPTLAKSAALYFDVLVSLSTGADYADLADVLEQSCADLVAAGEFVASDCASVAAGVAATEMRSAPFGTPVDAPATCPAGTTQRVLVDGRGDASSLFQPGPTWAYGQLAGWGSKAHTGDSTWYSTDPDDITDSRLTLRTGVALPAGQASYLHFYQWRLFDSEFNGDYTFYDGGTVRVNGANAASMPWVNGPTDVLDDRFGNPAGGQLAFSGHTQSVIASRLDLSAFAGTTVTPSFRLAADNGVAGVGWFLDDIVIYTCDPAPALPGGTAPPPAPAPLPPPPAPQPSAITAAKPVIKGTARVGKRLTARPGAWQPAGVTLGYQWLRNGKAITKAKKSRYVLVAKDRGKRISVRVTGRKAGYVTASATSKATAKVKPRR
ncbi:MULTISPECIES: M4 family metallopeptidase [unclassified Nocardioides]|uniref:M4 family metallopeptidase n=1 Tax=unclassified Nocardioides TaxID=2615069 RepID=UPI00361D7316